MNIIKKLDPKKKRKALIKSMDSLWAKKIKSHAGGRCEVFGCNNTGTNAHHIITRSIKALRWDLNNGICLCAWHHVFSPQMSAHKAPREFIEWFDMAFPGRYAALAIRKRNRLKTDLWALEMIKKDLLS